MFITQFASSCPSISVICCHVGTYWAGSLLFLGLDYYWHKRGITKYKFLEGNRPFAPTRKIVKAIALSLCNQALSVPFIYYTAPYCISKSLNFFSRTPLCFLGYLFLADQWFYWVHRFMHSNKFIFRHIHMVHHQWVHPMAIRAIYAHPVEHIVGNIGSIAIGPLFFPTTPGLLCGWIVMSTLNSVISHSGTKIPYFNDESHDMHHRVLSCNYGFMGLSDRLHKTYRADY